VVSDSPSDIFLFDSEFTINQLNDTMAASTSRAVPKLSAALLLSRSPLLTPTPSALETSYYAYSSSLRSALSNPAPHDFYFKPGSLASRRFLDAQYTRDAATFGERLAGRRPDVGDIPAEAELEPVARDAGDQSEAMVGRRGEDEVYLVVQDNAGKWGFLNAPLQQGEALHQAAVRALGEQLGDDMDTWLVTRKPIGVATQAEQRVCRFVCSDF
jgi:large subunit ribosomal protein L46